MSPWWKRVTDPAPDPQLDRGARQRLMVAAAPPVVPAQSPHADVAAWRIRAEGLEQALNDECSAHADTIKLVERLRATPTPEDLWMEVRASEEGQRARHFQRMYGKASATIGALRDQLARVRAQREDAESVVVAVAVALGCGPQPSEQWLLDTAVRAGQLLAEDGETFRRKLLDAAVEAEWQIKAAVRVPPWLVGSGCPRCGLAVEVLPERRVCDDCEQEVGTRLLTGVIRSGPSTGPRYSIPAHGPIRFIPADADPADTAKVGDADCTPYAETWCSSTGPAVEGYTEPGCTRAPGHDGQHVAGNGSVIVAVWPNDATADADAALVERARVLGDEIGQRDRTAAIEGAAITLAAHAMQRGKPLCTCGWDDWTVATGEDHARHVAEQLAAVGALGNSGLSVNGSAGNSQLSVEGSAPVLIDRDGDEWAPHYKLLYRRLNAMEGLPSLHRETIEDRWGPVTEKAGA